MPRLHRRDPDRIVVDTNVFVSAIALPRSVPRQAVNRMLDSDVLLFSEATMTELVEVLHRPKLDHYVSPEDRAIFLGQLGTAAEFVPIIQLVRECRDPKDDKFLEVALNGRADVIVTGDADLLRMHPRREIAIMSPANYLSR
jgi:putative PIN family toxin of toxin-antitoxin system